jgi:hypothetical protein
LNYKVLRGRLRIKRDMRKLSLDDQERYLALRMPTSERLTPEGREKEPAQNNNEVKCEQLKFSKIDPSTQS